MPLLNITIDSHIAAHNHHPSSTRGTRGWTPYRTWMDGVLQAARRGMSLEFFPSDHAVDEEGFTDEMLEGDDDEDNKSRHVSHWPSEQQREDQNRLQLQTDPYVEVERYHELLPPLLRDEDFRNTMCQHFPPPTQHTRGLEDDHLFDTRQYLALRTWVYDSMLALQNSSQAENGDE